MNNLSWPIKGASLATVLLVYGPTLHMVEAAKERGFASRVHGWSMREIVATLPPSMRDLGRQIILDKAGV